MTLKTQILQSLMFLKGYEKNWDILQYQCSKMHFVWMINLKFKSETDSNLQ